MRRPRPTSLARWCLTLVTALLITAWSLSHSWQFRWAGFARSIYYTGQSARGELNLTIARPCGNVGWTIGWDLKSMPSTNPAALGTSFPSPLPLPWWGQWTTTKSTNFRRDELTVPYWLFTVPLALITTLTWLAVLIRARRTPGICLTCAYDRRGLPANAACPECGTAPTQ